MRLVVKVGTRVLCRDDGVGLDRAVIASLARVLASLAREHEVLLVSSGAVGAGLLATGRRQRPSDTPSLQALAAVGQVRLMQEYAQALAEDGLRPGQLLLTYGDLDTDESRRRVRQSIDALWALGQTIPVLNENDSVAVDELRFGDNDLLSARAATLVAADLLVLLTSVDGFLVDDGAGGRRLLKTVTDPGELETHVKAHTDPLSRGGMTSKLGSIRHALAAGIPCAIAHGRHPERLLSLVRDEPTPSTRFLPAVVGEPGSAAD